MEGTPVSSIPGEEVRRPNPRQKKKSGADQVPTKSPVTDVIRESVSEGGLTPPSFGESEKMQFAMWKIRMAYAYLAFTSALCVAAVLINPTLDVRLVCLALWGASSGAMAVLLRKEYRKKL
jgi:hypothetical protein